MLTAKQRAFKTIATQTTTWEKVKAKLEAANDVIMAWISKKNVKIANLQEEVKHAQTQIDRSKNYIINQDRMFDTPAPIKGEK
ncbi:MAG: hypothetical protein GY799_20950 [Desulfobulbaceae bacterium]|nr:hypothetical protein [Desulfobulbaceae bacterium]